MCFKRNLQSLSYEDVGWTFRPERTQGQIDTHTEVHRCGTHLKTKKFLSESAVSLKLFPFSMLFRSQNHMIHL